MAKAFCVQLKNILLTYILIYLSSNLQLKKGSLILQALFEELVLSSQQYTKMHPLFFSFYSSFVVVVFSPHPALLIASSLCS